MKLHGWTDAFQRYFHSFYRKKKIKLVNRRIHTKSIYFVDLNQDFSRKMWDVTATFSQLFIGRMKLNLLTAEHTQKQFTFYQGCVEKRQRWKNTTNQIMTFHGKCQTDEMWQFVWWKWFSSVVQWKSFILGFTPVPLYWDLNRICSSIGSAHMMCLLHIIISHIYKKKKEDRICKRIVRRKKRFFNSQKLSSW